jgi:hypothetical protein
MNAGPKPPRRKRTPSALAERPPDGVARTWNPGGAPSVTPARPFMMARENYVGLKAAGDSASPANGTPLDVRKVAIQAVAVFPRWAPCPAIPL